ncbi:MAG: hypothetical protein RLP44_01100 [Aggregatilineales bacterium]
MATDVVTNRTADPVIIDDRVQVDTTKPVLPSALRRVSWQAILSGVAVAVILQLALNLLGLSIGASTIDPLYDQDPLQVEFAAGVVVWLAASVLISLFAGGWVAGRMSGMIEHVDGALHGVVTWAVVSFLSVLFLSSTVGGLLGTASNLLSGGVNLAQESVETLSPEVADALELQDIRLQSITEEARDILNITSTDVEQAQDVTEETTQDVVQNPSALSRELDLGINRLLTLVDPSPEDRQAVVTLLMEQGNLTEQEAQQTIDNWQATYNDVATQAEETAREVGQAVADSVAVIAGVFFMILLVGAFAAGAGGIVGISGKYEALNFDTFTRRTVKS